MYNNWDFRRGVIMGRAYAVREAKIKQGEPQNG